MIQLSTNSDGHLHDSSPTIPAGTPSKIGGLSIDTTVRGEFSVFHALWGDGTMAPGSLVPIHTPVPKQERKDMTAA